MNAPGELVVGPEPFYFRDTGPPLFGCFHPAISGRATSGGVLLCSPWGHEYMASHRAMRQMAVRLSQRGWSAFRFDMYGCGDSSGTSADGAPSKWLADVHAAGDELRRRLPLKPLVLLGLRLGATLALLHLENVNDTSTTLVLWDPVVDGRAWIADLVSRQEHEPAKGESEDAVFGVPLPNSLRVEIENLDLLRITRAPARVLVIDGVAPRADTIALVARLRELGSIVEQRTISYPPAWLDPGSSLVPGSAIQSITAWLGAGQSTQITE
jgi:pimeloyl-ACP methyl ester carboxylesterase